MSNVSTEGWVIILGVIFTGLVSVINAIRMPMKIEEVKKELNGKLSQYVEAKEAAAHARGMKDGADAERESVRTDLKEVAAAAKIIATTAAEVAKVAAVNAAEVARVAVVTAQEAAIVLARGT